MSPLFYVALTSNGNISLLSVLTPDNSSNDREVARKINSAQVSQFWAEGYSENPFIKY